MLMVNGALNKFGAGIRIVIIHLDLSSIKHAILLEFQGSNNEVECESLMAKMLMATKLRVKNLKICTDFNLDIS